MIIEFHKNFDKKYQKLSRSIQEKVDTVLEVFIRDPFDRSLKNHALKGNLKGKRAIHVMGNMRIIFEEYGKYVLVVMLDVGTHNQV